VEQMTVISGIDIYNTDILTLATSALSGSVRTFHDISYFVNSLALSMTRTHYTTRLLRAALHSTVM